MRVRRLLPVLALLPVVAAAAATEAQTVWACWTNQQQQVACLLQSSTPGAGPVGTAQAPMTSAWPPSLQTVRGQPARLRGRTLLIPLHTEPFDPASVAELARAVLCGSQPGCRVSYGEQPAETPEAAANFADANDPLLQGGE